jgi:hypothetical protein
MTFKTFFLAILLIVTVNSLAYAQSLLVCNSTAGSLFDDDTNGWYCSEYSPNLRRLDPAPTISSLLKDGWKFSNVIHISHPTKYIVIFVKD